MNTSETSVALYPQPMPPDMQRAEVRLPYLESYAAAVAKVLGCAAHERIVRCGNFNVRIEVWGNGSVRTDCLESVLRGWGRAWPARKGVLVKPETVAAHLRVMAKLSAEEAGRETAQDRLSALNRPAAEQLSAQLRPDGMTVEVSPSGAREGWVIVRIPSQSYFCAVEQAQGVVEALNAVPVTRAQKA